MNLDDLISKYIDGELTEYEDDFLRQRISADKLSRKKFDDAINLTIAFKEDAKSIVPPVDLIDRTEDVILMKILAKAPESRKRRIFAWNNASMLAASIIALMFLMVFQISDYTFKNKSNIHNKLFVSKNVEKSNRIIEKKEKVQKSKIKSSNLSKISSKKKTSKKVYSFKSSGTGASSVKINSLKIGNNIAMVSGDDEELSKTFPSVVNQSVNTNLNLIKKERLNSLYIPKSSNSVLAFTKIGNSSLDNHNITYTIFFNEIQNSKFNNRFVNNNNEVQVASFFGTDIVRTGKNASSSAISHFSQSVAYSLNKNERIGVELGYTEYAYDEKAVVNVKKKMGSLIAGVESNETGYGFSFNYQQPIVLKNNKQMIWASVFYENSLINYNSLALIGRVGIGATNEGPLGYGRIFANFNLFSSFDLTLGAEGRLYSARLPEFVGDNSRFNASCSLIYGFQFKF